MAGHSRFRLAIDRTRFVDTNVEFPGITLRDVALLTFCELRIDAEHATRPVRTGYVVLEDTKKAYVRK